MGRMCCPHIECHPFYSRQIVDRFYKLSGLTIRQPPSRPLDFEPIVLSVPFNYEAAQKLYPSILGFIGLLEVFRLVISADPEGERRVIGMLCFVRVYSCLFSS